MPQHATVRGFVARLSKNYDLIINREEQVSRRRLADDRRDPEEAEIARHSLEIEDTMLKRNHTCQLVEQLPIQTMNQESKASRRQAIGQMNQSQKPKD